MPTVPSSPQPASTRRAGPLPCLFTGRGGGVAVESVFLNITRYGWRRQRLEVEPLLAALAHLGGGDVLIAGREQTAMDTLPIRLQARIIGQTKGPIAVADDEL